MSESFNHLTAVNHCLISAHFVTSPRGFPMLQIGGYRYGLKTGYKGLKKRWVCARWHCGCRATVITLEDTIVELEVRGGRHTGSDRRVQYIRSRFGKPLLQFGEYTFCVHRTTGNRSRWICSSHHGRKCRAAVYTYDNKSEEEEELEFYYTKSKFGNKMLVVNGYRFKFHQDLKHGEKRWLCINTKGCRAFAITADDVLARVNDSHNHPLVVGKAAKTRKVAIADGDDDTKTPYYLPIDD
ncbi:FLYWCH zinc finger domain-containing protein [Phthorimaea operculella]|nr:FLYWCH zinc finger domain-containing protein [Phthorimaea operculella]